MLGRAGRSERERVWVRGWEEDQMMCRRKIMVLRRMGERDGWKGEGGWEGGRVGDNERMRDMT